MNTIEKAINEAGIKGTETAKLHKEGWLEEKRVVFHGRKSREIVVPGKTQPGKYICLIAKSKMTVRIGTAKHEHEIGCLSPISNPTKKFYFNASIGRGVRSDTLLACILLCKDSDTGYVNIP